LADLYEAIKAIFDADAALAGASGAFDELHAGEVGDPAAVPAPYCTVVTPEESTEEGTFGGERFVAETFAFQVVAATLEDSRDKAGLVNAVFDDDDLVVAADGIGSVRLEKGSQRSEQADEDRWVVTIDYRAMYWRTRP